MITKKHIYMLGRQGHTDTALVHGSYLILLGKPQAVVGLQSLYVVGQVNDRNGRVLPHSWEGKRRKSKRGEDKEKSESGCFLYQTCTSTYTNTGWTTGWVRLPAGPWGGCVTVRRVHFVQQCMKSGREERERTSWNRLVTFGDIWWYRHAKWGGQRWGWRGDAHEWLGEHAPGRKQETDISLTPQRSIGGRGGIRARTHKSLQISHTVTSQRGKKLTGHQPKLISLKISFPTIDYLSAQPGALGLD